MGAPAVRSGPLVPSVLGIIPTRACNIACVYCGFRGGVSERMPVRLAENAVAWATERCHSAGQRALDLHFVGGEPLIAPEVVRAAVGVARREAARLGLEVSVEILTNGMAGDETATWVGEAFDRVVVSLDGPEDLHDRHRPMAGGGPGGDPLLRLDETLRWADAVSRRHPHIYQRIYTPGVALRDEQVAQLAASPLRELRLNPIGASRRPPSTARPNPPCTSIRTYSSSRTVTRASSTRRWPSSRFA